MPDTAIHACPLCEGQVSESNDFFHQDQNKKSQRLYLRCTQCYLVFVPSRFYLSAEQEKAEYELHDNQPHDEHYRRFLNRLWQPLKTSLPPQAKILEFGCGPGPALAHMMQEQGHEVSLFDVYFHPDESVLKKNYYDCISATEVLEHLHQPGQVLGHMLTWLKAGGCLGFMTKLVKDQAAFQSWHYKNDLTHVCFFCKDTFAWIADQFNLQLEIIGSDVIILKRRI